MIEYKKNPSKLPLLMVYFLLFSAFGVPYLEGNIGPISFQYALDLTLIGFLTISIILYLTHNKKIIFSHRYIKQSIYFYGAFCILYGVTLLYSYDPILGLRYYPKYIYVFLLFIYFTINYFLNIDKAVTFLIYGVIFFLSISIISNFILSPDPFAFIGPSGRHTTKFVCAFGFILGISHFLSYKDKKLGIILITLSSVSLFVVLQRGAIFAALFGSIFIVFSTIKFTNLRSYVLVFFSFIILYLFTYHIFSSEVFQAYAFYRSISLSDIISSIKSGTFDIGMIRDRGRINFINYLINNSEWSIFGLGLGSVPYILSPFSRDSHYELHNDIILLIYEGGIFYYL